MQREIFFKLSIWKDIIFGYINKDLSPKKCRNCKCKKFKKGETWNDDICGYYREVEFLLYCEKCGKEVGHWSYGSWML